MRKFTLLSLMLVFVAATFSSNTILAQTERVAVADLEELRAQEADGETVYEVSGEVILTHQHAQRNQKYVQDAAAAIMIDDSDGIITTDYELYDGITGLVGTLTTYNNFLQFIPTDDFGPATSTGNTVDPLVVTLADLDETHQAMLIKVVDLDFDGEYTTFSSSSSYDITDPTGTGMIRTPSSSAALDYFETTVPTGPMDMVALVSQYNDDMQIFPRSLEDIYLDGVPTFTLDFNVIDENGDAITDAIITFDGAEEAAGSYSFADVLMGAHTYSIAKDGFHTRADELILNENTTLDVILVAEDADIVEAFPWEEGFETSVPPAIWNEYTYGEGAWETSASPNSGSAAAKHILTTSESDSWLVTPQLSIPTDIELILKFYEKNSFMGDYGFSGVMISTGSGNPEQGEFVEVYESSSSLSAYTEKVIDLSDYAGEVIYIAFVYQGTNAHEWFIDDVTVEEAPEIIQVENLAELRSQGVSDLVYEITGEVVITHIHGQRNQKYIQDETAAMLIDDADGIITTEYELYDGITGLKGILTEYNSLLQFVPEEDPGAATSTENTVEPLTITLDNITTEHQSMLVFVEEVTIDPAEDTEFQTSTSYDISDASGTSILRTPSSSAELDYFETEIPTSAVDMIAMVSQFGDDMQIFPRSLEDIIEISNVDETLNSSFAVYPNPAKHNLNITGKSVINSVRVFSITGQLVKEVNVNKTSANISIEDLNSGLYIVQVVTNAGTTSQKIQVQK
ncbi:MAG: DUF5689 domain-containing protein [Bacteroidales bacterium]